MEQRQLQQRINVEHPPRHQYVQEGSVVNFPRPVIAHKYYNGVIPFLDLVEKLDNVIVRSPNLDLTVCAFILMPVVMGIQNMQPRKAGSIWIRTSDRFVIVHTPLCQRFAVGARLCAGIKAESLPDGAL